MGSQLFSMLGQKSNLPTPFSNMQEMISKLNQFRQSFKGDPKEQVQQLLNSGKMSQNQYNQLSQMATQIQNMLNQK